MNQTNLPISVTLPLRFGRMVTDMKGALNPHDFRWGDLDPWNSEIGQNPGIVEYHQSIQLFNYWHKIGQSIGCGLSRITSIIHWTNRLPQSNHGINTTGWLNHPGIPATWTEPRQSDLNPIGSRLNIGIGLKGLVQADWIQMFFLVSESSIGQTEIVVLPNDLFRYICNGSHWAAPPTHPETIVVLPTHDGMTIRN